MRVVFQFMPKNNQKSVCEKELLIFTKKRIKKVIPTCPGVGIWSEKYHQEIRTEPHRTRLVEIGSERFLEN